MINVTLFSRQNCQLCDEVLAQLDHLREEYPHEVDVIDIDQDPKLKKKLDDQIPVLQAGPYTLHAPITESQLRITLAAVADRERHTAQIEESARTSMAGQEVTISSADRISYWISRHYLAVINLLIFIYLGLPFLAPTLMKSGNEQIAKVIYSGYSIMCHQLAFRSMFLFGEQLVYPRAAAGVNNLITYEQATGNNPEDLLTARAFLGNDVMGFKVALCERDVAIYAGLLLFGLVFAATGRKLPPLPWYAWILIGIAPIALDGFSQLFSQLPIPLITSIFPYRESTPFLRYFTGFLFGFTTGWFGIPMVESSMRDTRQILDSKFERYRLKEQANLEAN